MHACNMGCAPRMGCACCRGLSCRMGFGCNMGFAWRMGFACNMGFGGYGRGVACARAAGFFRLGLRLLCLLRL